MMTMMLVKEEVGIMLIKGEVIREDIGRIKTWQAAGLQVPCLLYLLPFLLHMYVSCWHSSTVSE
jgi:hypothetical protein